MAVCFLERFKQPGVLDRSHRLVRERLQQGDLLSCERTHLRLSEMEHADDGTVTQHWHGERCAIAALRGQLGTARIGVRSGLPVRDVVRPTIDDDPPDDGPGVDRIPVLGCERRVRTDVCCRPAQLAVNVENGDVVSGAQVSRRPGDRVQDDIDVGRRGGDNPQDVSGGGLLLQCLGQRRTKSPDLTAQGGDLRLQPRDPRVRIVRHHAHPGPTAPLRDGAKIARGLDGAL